MSGTCAAPGDACLPTAPGGMVCISRAGAGDPNTKQCPDGSPYNQLLRLRGRLHGAPMLALHLRSARGKRLRGVARLVLRGRRVLGRDRFGQRAVVRFDVRRHPLRLAAGEHDGEPVHVHARHVHAERQQRDGRCDRQRADDLLLPATTRRPMTRTLVLLALVAAGCGTSNPCANDPASLPGCGRRRARAPASVRRQSATRSRVMLWSGPEGATPPACPAAPRSTTARASSTPRRAR